MLQLADIGRIDSSIRQNLKFDSSIQITWKRKATEKSDLFEQAQIFAGTTTPKLANRLLSLSLWGRWFVFKKQNSKHPFAEFLKNRCS